MAHDEDDIVDFLSKFPLPEGFRGVAEHILQQPGALQTPSVDPHLRALTTEAHRATNFSMTGHDAVAAPRMGTRPGDGLADFVSCAAFQRPFAQIRETFRARWLMY